MMLSKNNKIKKIVISIISILLCIGLISVAYAFFTYSETGNKNNQLIIGNVYLDLHEIDGINITNFEPQEEKPNDYYEFEIKGTNESDKDVVYDIEILHGNDSTQEGAIRVADKFVSFSLMKEVSTNNWETVIDKEKYNDFSNPLRIYVDRFDANTTEETSQKYRLYAWINRDMEVYAGSLTSDAGDYSIEEFKKLYASVKIKVTGDFQEKLMYTVTFDYNDGVTESTTKNVIYHNNYGTLPEPTRDGYTFLGWSLNDEDYQELEYIESTGKQVIDTGVAGGNNNLSFEIKYSWSQLPNSDEYRWVFGNYKDEQSNVTRLIQYGPDTTYSNVNTKARGGSVGYSGTRRINSIYIDKIRQSHYETNNEVVTRSLNNGDTYNGSIFVFGRAANTNSTSKIKLYYFKIFDNDVLIRDYIPVINKANGKRGLLDKTNNVFYGDALNSNEEFKFNSFYINNNTKVTEDKNHTLKAIWIRDDEAPTLSLEKVTYKEIGFSDWTLNNASVDSNGVLTTEENTSRTFATSNYINVNGGFWYPVFDAYTSSTRIGYDSIGGVYWNSMCYDNNYVQTLNLKGVSDNGWMIPLSLNEWHNDLNWYTFYGYTKSSEPRYGPNVNYIRLSFEVGNNNSQAPIKIRNLKIYGEEIYNNFYLINVTSSDNIGVVETKYAKGNQNASYFSTNGYNVENNQIKVLQNGVYTVYVRDAAGNETVDTIEITNIK